MQKIFVLVLTVTVLHISAQQVKCVLNSKYFMPNFKANWFKATQYCNYLGMRLAIVATPEEQAKLTTMIESTDQFNNRSTEVWIGGSDLADEGTFYWQATGMSVRYANWHGQQPDNGAGIEHCMEIRYIPSDGWNWHWNDRDCKTMHFFVCENNEFGREITLF